MTQISYRHALPVVLVVSIFFVGCAEQPKAVATGSADAGDVWERAGMPLRPLGDLPVGVVEGAGPVAQLQAWRLGVRLWRGGGRNSEAARPASVWVGVDRPLALERERELVEAASPGHVPVELLPVREQVGLRDQQARVRG